MIQQFSAFFVAVTTQIYTCDKIAENSTLIMSVDCTSVNFFLYYDVRCYHWEKLGKGYTGPLCTVFEISCEGIVILKQKF